MQKLLNHFRTYAIGSILQRTSSEELIKRQLVDEVDQLHDELHKYEEVIDKLQTENSVIKDQLSLKEHIDETVRTIDVAEQ